jgi:hypothetical protein
VPATNDVTPALLNPNVVTPGYCKNANPPALDKFKPTRKLFKVGSVTVIPEPTIDETLIVDKLLMT